MKNDKELQRDVLEELLLEELQWEPSVDAVAIGVTVSDGIVTLAGHAPSYTEKVSAEEVAQHVQGARAVVNDIEVRLRGTGEHTDADISRAAVATLKWKTLVPDERIKITVSEGWVTLDGDVDWQYQKESAQEAVRHLLGVKGVHNQIVVKPRASAAEVKSHIEAAFRRRAGLRRHRVV
ncbi:MAG: BON domain-containing protein [Isosphaeraceae bacterium]